LPPGGMISLCVCRFGSVCILFKNPSCYFYLVGRPLFFFSK